MSKNEEKMLVALLLKVSILAVMDSTCYSFAGRIYKQMWGAGIGLRASACMAKIIMGLIDKLWAKTQHTWDIKLYLYFRYIDDLTSSYIISLQDGNGTKRRGGCLMTSK